MSSQPYPPDELLCLPDHAELLQQMSVPLTKTNTAGKVLLESKTEMRVRGVASPDFADALALCFMDEPRVLLPEEADAPLVAEEL